MSYELAFDRRALREWRKLDPDIREQLKRKLAHILDEPHTPANRLRELPGCYKIKLRSAGYRLIYQVQDENVLVLVIAIGVRNKGESYTKAQARHPRNSRKP